jgi:hypothetical protein
MLTALFSLLGGLLTSTIPTVLKMFQDKSDKKHELAMFEAQVKAQERLQTLKIEELNTTADIEVAKQAYEYAKPMEVVPMIPGDAKWIPFVNAFNAVLVVFANFLTSTVRPVVTYLIVALYVHMKLETLHQFKVANVSEYWTELDTSIFCAIIGFWFGSRMMSKYAKNK